MVAGDMLLFIELIKDKLDGSYCWDGFLKITLKSPINFGIYRFVNRGAPLERLN
jgi:hypothetical protein